MAESVMLEKAKDFAVDIVTLCKEESEYWLELLNRTGYIADERYQKILNACGAIRRMLISSINTVKKNNGPDKE